MAGTNQIVNDAIVGIVNQIKHDICGALGLDGCCNLTVTRYAIDSITVTIGGGGGGTIIGSVDTLRIRVCVNGCEYCDLLAEERSELATGIKVVFTRILAENVDPAAPLTSASP